MASIFTKIIQGQIPSYKIAETNHVIAILDVFPIVKGHTLVIPKKEVDNLFELDTETYHELLSFSKKIALAIQSSYTCNRVSMHVIGLEVPHAHIHLIPITTTNDCNFSNPKLKFTESEFVEISKRIQQHLK